MAEIQLGGGRVYRGETDERGRISGNGKAFDARGRLVYDGQWRTGKPHGKGKEYRDGALIYDGEWYLGKRQGRGISYEPGGIRYEGEWFNGEKDGPGALYENGALLYKGEWEEGQPYGDVPVAMRAPETLEQMPEGKPDLTFPDGSAYYGGVSHGRRDGSGKLIRGGKTVYDGGWKYDQRSGFGKEYGEDGALIYEGEWNLDRRHGRGREYERGSLLYEGQWIMGSRGGSGREYRGGVLVYDGEWSLGRRRGFGTSYEPDGRRYEGQWFDNKQHGTGRLYEDDRLIYDGEWSRGEPTEPFREPDGAIKMADGSLFYGHTKRGKKEGNGRLVRDGKTVYDGEWKLDERSGYGREYGDDGSLLYEGEWKLGKRYGRGKEHKNGTLIYDGEWRLGKRDGEGKEYRDGALVYEGEWYLGKRQGQGTSFEPDGRRYEGEWYEGRKDGDGRLYEGEQLLYDGEWNRGKPRKPIPEPKNEKEMPAEKENANLPPIDPARFLTVSDRGSGDDISPEVEQLFAGIIGMDAVKAQLDRIYRRWQMDAMRRQRLGVENPDVSYNFILTGNPGTGKTVVARIIGRMLHRLGLLPEETFVERDRGSLVGAFIGHTEMHTRAAIKEARGGTLFIDEAYALFDKESGKDFGHEAIEVLLKDLEDHRGEYCVILAGYRDKMEEMMRGENVGFASRFPYHIHIDDYSTSELIDIMVVTARKQNYFIEKDAREVIVQQLHRLKVDDTFANGRSVRNLLGQAIERQADRLTRSGGDISSEDLVTLRAEDFGTLELSADSLEAAMEKLDRLIGLAAVKSQVHDMVSRAQVQLESRRRGLPIADGDVALHMVFTGSPGTGKTTVARIIQGIYYQLGLLKRPDRFVECGRGDLVGTHQGETARQTAEKVREALGGVLFIDEAYSLVSGPQDAFGLEAVATLVREIENQRDNLMVVLAGYTGDMETFMRTNPGLSSRFPKTIRFEDYSLTELVEIFRYTLTSRGYRIDAEDDIIEDTIRSAMEKTRDFGNARGVRNLCDEAVVRQTNRIGGDGLRELSDEELMTITAEDIRGRE